MAQKTRAEIKSLFTTGDDATEFDFADLADSFFNLNDDSFSGSGLSENSIGTFQIQASALNILTNLSKSVMWEVSASGHLVPISQDLQDLGSLTREVRSLYLGDSGLFIDGNPVIHGSTGNIVLEVDFIDAGTF